MIEESYLRRGMYASFTKIPAPMRATLARSTPLVERPIPTAIGIDSIFLRLKTVSIDWAHVTHLHVHRFRLVCTSACEGRGAQAISICMHPKRQYTNTEVTAALCQIHNKTLRCAGGPAKSEVYTASHAVGSRGYKWSSIGCVSKWQ
jgi:hypothetical protein